MYLPNNKPMTLQTILYTKQCNTLSINDLVGGVLRNV